MLKGQQHLTHSTLECLLSKEISSTTTLLSSSEGEGPSGSYPGTIVVGDTAALAKHCYRANKTSLKADERLSKVSLS